MKKKTPHDGGASKGAELFTESAYQNTAETSCDLGKMSRMLLFFYQGLRLHRYQAERLGDHCLPSTISTFANTHGLIFHRRMVKVPNRFGTKTSVKQYWLADESKDAAMRFLEARGALSAQGE